MGSRAKMAATKLAFLLTLLYIIKVQWVMAQAIAGCNGPCPGYGFCGGIYPTVVDTSDNTDPLDVILPVLLLAICNRVGGVNAPAPTNTLNGGVCGTTDVPINGCFGGCGGGGCSSGCGGACSGVPSGGCGSTPSGGCNSACSSACSSASGSGSSGGCCNGNVCSGPVIAATAGLPSGCCSGCGCC